MSQGALHFEALLTTQDFERGMDRLRNDIRSAAGLAQTETAKMDSAFKNLSIGIGSYFSAQALMGFTRELINVRGEFQKTEIAFGTMLGSSEKAKTLMGQMTDLAAKTPFSLQDVSSGAKQLLAFQVPAKDIVDTLTRMGNIAAGLSVPLERVNMVYGQVKAKGRLQGDDLKQFTEMGIPMIHELANSLGKADSEISKMVSDGKVGFSDVKKVLFNLTNEGGMFYNLMEKQSESLSGKVSNLGDAFSQMLNKIGTENQGALSGGIDELSYLVSNYHQVIEAVKELVLVYGSYKAAIIFQNTAQSFANKTVETEIALLSSSTKLKLENALATEKQAAAELENALSERQSAESKISNLQVDAAVLANKRENAVQSMVEAQAKLDSARASLVVAQSTASEMEAKAILSAQNKVIAAEETAAAARKKALAASSEFYAAKAGLEAAATSGIAEKQLIAMRAEVSALAVKKEAAVQSGINAQAKLAEAEADLTAARTTSMSAAAKKIATAEAKIQAAQEALNTAAKNENAIATQMQTLQQEINTAATEAGIAAQAVGTAEEIANTAAKEANAIATAELSIAQKMQVLVTNGVTAANNALNKTIFANPYAIATALVIGFVYALAKMATQASYAEEIQDKVNKKLIEAHQSVEEQKSKIESLVEAIKSENTSNEKRETLLNRIKTLANGRLDQLTVEAIRTGKATDAINQYIAALDRQAKAKAYMDLKADAYKRIAEIDASGGKHTVGEAAAAIFDANTYKNAKGQVTGSSIVHGVIDNFDDVLAKNRQLEKEENLKKIEEYNNQIKKSGNDIADSETDAGNKEVDAIKDNTKKVKHARQEHTETLQEVVSPDSIIALERRVENWNAALQRMHTDKDGNKVVDVLTQDKYGKQVKTGETIGLEEALKRAQQDEEKLAAARKEIQIKSFDEEISEAKRQIEVRDKLIQSGLPKDEANKLFGIGDKSFIQFLTDTESRLSKIKNPSLEVGENLFKMREAIKDYKGEKTFVEVVADKIEDLKRRFSGDKLIKELDKYKSLNVPTEDGGYTDAEKNVRDKAAQKAIDDELKRKRDEYAQFLQDHKSYEDMKTEITRDAAAHREMIAADGDLSPEKKDHYTSESQKQELEAKARLAADFVRNLPLWDEISSSLDSHLVANVDKLIDELEKKIKEKGKDMNPIQLRGALDELRKLKERVSEENPFLGLKISFDDLIVSINEKTDGTATAAVEKFGRVSESVGGVAKSMGKVLDALAPVREYMSESANETIDTIQGILQFGQMASQAMSSTANAVNQALKSGTWSNWITAIIQIIYLVIKAIVSLVTWMSKVHDKKLQKQINEHKAAVENLKDAYEDLGTALKSALGSDTRQLQLQQIKNLQEQNREIEKMRKAEDDKKKTDKQKIADYDNQIRDNKQKMAELHDEIIKNILQTDAKDAASKLGDALVEAFSKGEDASKSMRDVANSMIQDIVKNMLKLRMEKQIGDLLNGPNGLLAQMGFDKDGNGSFMGLSPAQIEAFKAQIAAIGQQQQGFLDAYQQLFQTDSAAAQGLKGDIKNVTEKTAGALEAQINAMRVNQVSGLEVMRSSLLQLSQIEFNTRRLHNMDKNLQELNQKTKAGLAGIGG